MTLPSMVLLVFVLNEKKKPDREPNIHEMIQCAL